MPEKKVIERVKRAAKQGKAPSTQAGEFVREEVHDLHKNKSTAKSKKQAVAIGLSKRARPELIFQVPQKRKNLKKHLAAGLNFASNI